ncbi:MerR family transcriptional regulator [Fructilactobacillus vespulae]|uniref:MerR family transcriptional regulator n=1 Tax=Fructilactobacillus vespulae TaxID=1249630 RepID=UPI0039B4406B
MKIEAVSKEFDIPKATLRYWESLGLLPPIQRDKSGYRFYSHRDLNWVMYIKVLRKAGMSIEKLKHYITLYRDPTSTRAESKELLIQQQVELRDKIYEINKTLNYLSYKVDNFDSHMIGYEDEYLAYNNPDQAPKV